MISYDFMNPDQSGVIPGSIRVIPRSIWGHSRFITGSFRDHFGVTPGFAVWSQRRLGAGSKNPQRRPTALDTPVADPGPFFHLKNPLVGHGKHVPWEQVPWRTLVPPLMLSLCAYLEGAGHGSGHAHGHRHADGHDHVRDHDHDRWP